MPNKFLSVLLLAFAILTADAVQAQELRTVYTMDEANKWIKDNAELSPEIITVRSSDTSNISKTILRRRKGDFFAIARFQYKILEEQSSVRYRAKYIFLDGFDLDKDQLDKTKKLISEEIKAGKPFQELSDKYGMDDNDTGGDTDWFDETGMVPEFVEAIKKYKKDDVFFVEIPDRNWHYVVLKTYDDDRNAEMQVLRAKK